MKRPGIGIIFGILFVVLGIVFLFANIGVFVISSWFIILFLVAILLVILVGWAVLSMSKFALPFLIDYVAGRRKQRVHVERSLDIDPHIPQTSIQLPNAELYIEGTDEPSITVTGHVFINATDKMEAEQRCTHLFRVEKTTNQHTIGIQTSNEKWTAMKRAPLHGKLTVRIPREQSVHILVNNGKITVLRMSGHVHLQSSNGKVIVEHIAGNVHVQTTNGAIEATNIQQNSTLQTTNGGIVVHTNVVQGKWQVTTVNGGIVMAVPQKIDATINASVTNGGVNGNLPWHANSRNQKKAILGAGTYPVELSTVNGGVQITQKENDA